MGSANGKLVVDTRIEFDFSRYLNQIAPSLSVISSYESRCPITRRLQIWSGR